VQEVDDPCSILISMTAGYDCAASDAPGNEDLMQQQDSVLDWYRYSLNVPMLTAPGDTIVYCSIEPNLAGGMLQKIAHESLADLSYRLLSKPMRMRSYSLFYITRRRCLRRRWTSGEIEFQPVPISISIAASRMRITVSHP
jgi:hypothetical protein